MRPLKTMLWYEGNTCIPMLVTCLQSNTNLSQIYIRRKDFLAFCGLTPERFCTLRARADSTFDLASTLRLWTPVADSEEGGNKDVYFAFSDIPHIMRHARMWDGKCGGSEKIAFLKGYAFYISLLGTELPDDSYEKAMSAYRQDAAAKLMEQHWLDKHCGDLDKLAEKSKGFICYTKFEDYPPPPPQATLARESTVELTEAGTCSVIIPQVITQNKEKGSTTCSDAVYTAKLQDAIEYMRQMQKQLSSLQEQCTYYLEQFMELLKRR